MSNKSNSIDAINTAHKNARDTVFALARERASNLEETARLLRIAVTNGDLIQIARLSESFEPQLAHRARELHATISTAQELFTKLTADDRCFCESLAHQGRPGPCVVCQRAAEQHA